MKILLLGASKTGTTAITYAIYEYLPDHEVIFEPASLKKIDYEKPNLIVKSLRVRDWKEIVEHAKQFDRRILIIRHPLDRLISLLLYAPFNIPDFCSDQVAGKYLELLQQKTTNPEVHHTREIIHYLDQLRGGNIVKGFQGQYQDMAKLMSSQLDFFILKYEDFIDGNLEEIGKYINLQFNSVDVEVPDQYQRVNRTKSYDDWKNWLTTDDLEQLSPQFSEISNIFQYDLTLDPTHQKEINPKQSYLYTKNVINEFRGHNFLPEFDGINFKLKEEGVQFAQALEQLKTGQLSQAKSFIQQGINLNPGLAGFYILLGKILIREKQLEAASAAISKALELNPEIEDHLPKKLLKIKNRQ